MISGPVSWLTAALAERWVLLLNHVLAAEPLAMTRLQPHANRLVRLQFPGPPWPLPSLPDVSLRVTPAGLFELAAAPGTDSAALAADVTVRPQIGSPVQAVLGGLRGQMPAVAYDGDAALAADLAWLVDNVRWDVREDLARFVGTGPSEQVLAAVTALGRGLRDAVSRATGRRPPGAPPQG